MKERKRSLKIFAVCLIGIMINLLGSFIAEKTASNIYLDCIGTTIVAAFGGYVPGIIVGLFTNIIKSINDLDALYYGVANVLVAVTAYCFVSRGVLKKKIGYIWLILTMTCLCVAQGYVFSGFIDNSILTGNDILIYLKNNFIWDLLDKSITVLMLICVKRILPDSAIKWLKIEGWQQKPLSVDEVINAKMYHNRRLSLRTKIMLLLLFASTAIGLVAMVISVNLYRDYTINEHIELAEGVADYVSSLLDAEHVDEYIESGDENEEYRLIEEKMYKLRESYPDIEYIYAYKIMEDGCHVVFDLNTDDLEGSDPGELIPFDESFEKYIPSLLQGKEIKPIISNDTYGWLITSYKPVYDKYGKCRCYVAADISMNVIRKVVNQFIGKMLSIFIGFIILIVAIGLWISEYNIVLPINTMSLSASAFVYDDREALEENVEKIKLLDIHTGDEIENMYQAFSKTTEDNMKYANDLQIKTETISKMQSALIMILADVVESRDESTGEHVRKTAAYTRIIMKKMLELGYYTEQLTEQFMYDVENSAPLHDIGKIKIPDAILNKNGKLTDEEFEVMKSHTTAGGYIIDQAIKNVPDSQYLNEAKNLAEYHHEKWNGKGYPKGLKGEDIPLSARIMAVADVFDALVSVRCYKKAFTFEEAMGIIKKDAGTHFDPKVADAFIQAENDVRRVAEHFSVYGFTGK